MRNLAITAFAALGALVATQAQAVTITAYFSNFDSAATVAPGFISTLNGALVQSVQGLAGSGQWGQCICRQFPVFI